jgi:hypothetical protein
VLCARLSVPRLIVWAQNISDSFYELPLRPAELSDEFWTLFLACTQTQPQARPPIENIVERLRVLYRLAELNPTAPEFAPSRRQYPPFIHALTSCEMASVCA